MLSYRHGYHAGNFADVLKHTVFLRMIEGLQQFAGPVLIIDTHAGGGEYDLSHDYAVKTGEYLKGIAKVWPKRSEAPTLFKSYLNRIEILQKSEELQIYPGSPALIAAAMRPQDHGIYFELHSTEVKSLKTQFGARQNLAILHDDGLRGMRRVLPTRGMYQGMRALVLTDPSYEIKQDFEDVPDAILRAWLKSPKSQFVIWYPVIDRVRVDAMLLKYQRSGMVNILRVEQCLVPDDAIRGMTGAGLLIVNPPMSLEKSLNESVPWLHEQLEATGPWSVDWVVGEAPIDSPSAPIYEQRRGANKPRNADQPFPSRERKGRPSAR